MAQILLQRSSTLHESLLGHLRPCQFADLKASPRCRLTQGRTMQSTYLLPPGIFHPAHKTRPRDLFAPVAELAGLAPQFIERLSQIKTLNLAKDTQLSTLALNAAINCIDQNHVDPNAIDLVIMASVYKDMA